jgi:hypothetical protein
VPEPLDREVEVLELDEVLEVCVQESLRIPGSLRPAFARLRR